VAAREITTALFDSAALLFKELKDADARNADRRYWARFDSASVVALGIVRAVEPLVMQRQRGAQNFSEHAPLWFQASVQVERLLKGPPVLRDSGFIALFPGSRDIRYLYVPKLASGQKRLLTLRAISALPEWLRAGVNLQRAFVVLDSLDSLDPGDTLRIVRRR
jgi:hypothetical protein